jgi:hypothetical protein
MEQDITEQSPIGIYPPGDLELAWPPPLFSPVARLLDEAERCQSLLKTTIAPVYATKYEQVTVVTMPENAVTKDGVDVTWLAMRLFIKWLKQPGWIRTRRVVTSIREERGKRLEELDLETLKRFGEWMLADKFVAAVQRAINASAFTDPTPEPIITSPTAGDTTANATELSESECESIKGFDLRTNASRELREIHTEVGDFSLVGTAEEQEEEQYEYLSLSESESDSEWNKQL